MLFIGAVDQLTERVMLQVTRARKLPTRRGAQPRPRPPAEGILPAMAARAERRIRAERALNAAMAQGAMGHGVIQTPLIIFCMKNH